MCSSWLVSLSESNNYSMFIQNIFQQVTDVLWLVCKGYTKIFMRIHNKKLQLKRFISTIFHLSSIWNKELTVNLKREFSCYFVRKSQIRISYYRTVSIPLVIWTQKNTMCPYKNNPVITSLNYMSLSQSQLPPWPIYVD